MSIYAIFVDLVCAVRDPTATGSILVPNASLAWMCFAFFQDMCFGTNHTYKLIHGHHSKLKRGTEYLKKF